MVESMIRSPQCTPAVDVDSNKKVSQVLIEGSVILKILKHTQDPYGTNGFSGMLLGMDKDGTLEITEAYSFPMVQSTFVEETIKVRNQYTKQIVKALGSVNSDQNVVGWYQNNYFGNFVEKSFIEAQASFQKGKLFDRSVVLVNDLAQESNASLNLHAYRLTDKFIQAYNEGNFSSANLVNNQLSHFQILEEIPIKIHNSHMATLLAHKLLLQSNNNYGSDLLISPIKESPLYYPNLDILNMSIDPYLEENLELLLDTLDDLHYDQGNYQYYQRQLAREQAKIQGWITKRKQENAIRASQGIQTLPEDEWKKSYKLPQEPSRFDCLLLNKQADISCKQIDDYAGPTIAKMFAIRDGMSSLRL